MGQSEWALLIEIVAIVSITAGVVRYDHREEARASLGLGLGRVRWFEVILVGFVALWLLVIWSAGDPPRFFV